MRTYFESQRHRTWLHSKLGLRGLGLLVALLVGCSSNSAGTQAGSGGASSSTGGSTSESGGQTTLGGATTNGGTTATGGSNASGGVAPGTGGTSGGSTATNSGGIATGGTTAQGGTTSTGGVTSTGGSASGGVTFTGGTTSAGGTLTTGGSTGGTTAMGGTAATGGVTSTGGNSATGGSSRTGGVFTDGGNSATGGTSRTGGVTSAGGNSATGGSSRTGGVTSAGGTTATGGATSTGGITIGTVTTTCPGAVPAGITSSYCSCDKFGSTTTSGFTVYNNVWGSGAGLECVWATTTTEWGVTAAHPQTGGVKSYPNISTSPRTVVSAINTYTSSFDITVPTGGSWEAAYDIWVRTPGGGGTRIEIMLWMYKTGGVGPISSGAGTPATVGGHSWNVYYGSNGGNDVVSFVRTSNTTTGTVDVKAILDWIIANDKTQYGVFTSNWTLDQVQWGFEISGDSGTQGFVNNSFSVSSS